MPDEPSKAKIMLKPAAYPMDGMRRLAADFLRVLASVMKRTPKINAIKKGLIWAMQNCHIEKKDKNPPIKESRQPISAANSFTASCSW